MPDTNYVGLHLITGPAYEPISVATAKTHMRIEGSADDVYIGLLIKTARDAIEKWTRRALYSQRWRLTLHTFQDYIELPKPPCLSIAAINYYDTAGVLTALSSTVYRLALSDIGILSLEYGQTWPNVYDVPAGVQIEFLCGYTSASSEGDPTNLIPSAIKHAILLWVAHLYENREAINVGNLVTEIPLGVADLLSPYRSIRF